MEQLGWQQVRTHEDVWLDGQRVRVFRVEYRPALSVVTY